MEQSYLLLTSECLGNCYENLIVVGMFDMNSRNNFEYNKWVLKKFWKIQLAW